MHFTKSTLLIMTILVAIVSLCSIAHSGSYDLWKCYSCERSGLLVEIEVVPTAWPGEEIGVTITVKATQANIYIRYIHVNISSLKENRDETMLNSTAFLVDAHLNVTMSEKTSYNVSIPEDTPPGLLHGKVEYAWSIEGDSYVLKEYAMFPATYVQNKPYEDLRQNYETLNGSYNDLEEDYARLESNFTALEQEYQQLEGKLAQENNATGLMYLFLMTTGIFVVTTILLLVKRPRTTPW